MATQQGVHPALNRIISGFDLVATGLRVMIGAVGPEEINTSLGNLRTQFTEAFAARGQHEGQQARVMLDLDARVSELEGVSRIVPPGISDAYADIKTRL